MFDTHCHLNDTAYVDVNQIVKTSKKSGIKYFLIPGVDIETSQKAIEIASVYRNVYASVGIHPTQELDPDIVKIRIQLEELISPQVKAFGETGLDYYRYASSRSRQLKYLQIHMDLARLHNLPLIIHTRASEDDMVKFLTANPYEGSVVLHSCPVHEGLLNLANRQSLYISVAGDITYDESKAIFIQKIPIERLLLETDSPYQTPYPVRNTTKFPNNPANLVLIAEKVADVKNIKVEDVVEKTTSNAIRLFEYGS